MHQSARCASEVQIFWPLTINSSPLSSARVRAEARSEPELGSEKPWHQISSQFRIFDRKRFFCSSVPWVMIVGPASESPSTLSGPGARTRATSSLKIAISTWLALWPPYSLGHDITHGTDEQKKRFLS